MERVSLWIAGLLFQPFFVKYGNMNGQKLCVASVWCEIVCFWRASQHWDAESAFKSNLTNNLVHHGNRWIGLLIHL